MVALLNKPLRLATDGGPERRLFPRKETRALVRGQRLDHSIPARQCPDVAFALRDLSIGGMSAITTTPLVPGERIAVCFPPQRPSHMSIVKTDDAEPSPVAGGWDIGGRVVRCQPAAIGYRVAIEFDAVP